jgi:hypothetical protein
MKAFGLSMGNAPIWTGKSLKSGNSGRFRAFLAKLLGWRAPGEQEDGGNRTLNP